MKTQLKVFLVLAAALAVVFSTGDVSLAFSAPGEMANCRTIESGLSFECDPVSNLAVVNSIVIPITGLDLSSFTTSLRAINDIVTVMPATSLREINDIVSGMPVTSLRSINDIVSSMPATSLRAINEIAFGTADLSLSDFDGSLPDDELKFDQPPLDDFYFGGQYGGMAY